MGLLLMLSGYSRVDISETESDQKLVALILVVPCGSLGMHFVFPSVYINVSAAAKGRTHVAMHPRQSAGG